MDGVALQLHTLQKLQMLSLKLHWFTYTGVEGLTVNYGMVQMMSAGTEIKLMLLL